MKKTDISARSAAFCNSDYSLGSVFRLCDWSVFHRWLAQPCLTITIPSQSPDIHNHSHTHVRDFKEMSFVWVLLRIQNYLRAQFSEASQGEIPHGLISDKRHVGMALHAQKRDKHNLRSFLLLLWFKIYLKVFEFGLKSIPVFSVLLLLSCGSERRIHRKLIRDKKRKWRFSK